MTRYTIREVQTKKDLRRFIKFPFELYKGCDQYVPPLIKGQEHELMHAASLKYCTRKMWLAEDENGKVVGRICAMLNPRYNEKYGTKIRSAYMHNNEDLCIVHISLIYEDDE